MRRLAWRLTLLALLLAGCASHPPAAMRLARRPEVMCKHCNCLMPSDVPAETMCPVCDCQRQAHQCVRGH